MSKTAHQTKIGAFVLETLTTGMYRNPLDSLREYIQNAFDSIRAAERENVIKSGAGRIRLSISENGRSLSLRDNGMGVSVSDIAARLVNIGMSSKNIEVDAGFRGIGRLAGIAYCDELVFKTQRHGEQKITTVTFNARALKEAMSPKNREVEELANVVNKYVTITTEMARKQEHFLEISMKGINDSGEVFLSSSKVQDYLSQVAPLGLDTQSFHYSKIFYDWIKKAGIDLPEVSIVIDNNGTSYELFKPYRKITYTTAQGKHKIDVKGLRFYPEDATGASPYWIWYADTNCPGVIGNDAVAGLRLRKSNIAIGLSERITDIFRLASESYARFNRYFIGEVHIQDTSIIPNAHRDDFEETPEWLAIREDLIRFAKERSREAYSLSEGRNADVEKLLTGADRKIEGAKKKAKIGLASKDEQKKIIDDLDKQIDRIKSAEKADRSEEERKRIAEKRKKLQTVRDKISDKPEFIAKKLKSSLNKKQQKIVSEILGLLYEVLETSTFEIAREAILKKYQIPEKD